MEFEYLDTMNLAYKRNDSGVDSAYGSFEEPYSVDWKFDLSKGIEQFLVPIDTSDMFVNECYSPLMMESFSPIVEPLTIQPVFPDYYQDVQVPQEPLSPTLSNAPLSPKERKEKKFPCSMCPSSFSRNHDLKRHLRIHLGIRPYKCQHCPKAFTRMDALHRHTTVGGCKSQK